MGAPAHSTANQGIRPLHYYVSIGINLLRGVEHQGPGRNLGHNLRGLKRKKRNDGGNREARAWGGDILCERTHGTKSKRVATEKLQPKLQAAIHSPSCRVGAMRGSEACTKNERNSVAGNTNVIQHWIVLHSPGYLA